MFIWEVFESLLRCPWKKFKLMSLDGEREHVISTDYSVGIEPHYILHECFYKGENIASESWGGFDGNIPIHSDGWVEVEEEMTKEDYEEYAYNMWGED